jgi:hypothetical protein
MSMRKRKSPVLFVLVNHLQKDCTTNAAAVCMQTQIGEMRKSNNPFGQQQHRLEEGKWACSSSSEEAVCLSN